MADGMQRRKKHSNNLIRPPRPHALPGANQWYLKLPTSNLVAQVHLQERALLSGRPRPDIPCLSLLYLESFRQGQDRTRYWACRWRSKSGHPLGVRTG